MASFTSVEDNVTLSLSYVGEKVDIALSGTYNMTILFQRAMGSKGSGGWETLTTYTTANATVADTYYTKSANETLRLIVRVDTSGTCTATLTSNTTTLLRRFNGPNGTELFSVYEGGAIVPNRTPVILTAATDLTRQDHAFRPIILQNATGFKVRLPDATGSGDEYDFYVDTKVTSGSHELNAFEIGDDDVNGLIVGCDAPGDEFTWSAQGTENMVSLGGTSNSTGGWTGDYVKFVDIKAGLWSVRGHVNLDGSEATPFGTDS